jgi:hypothetical protein
MTLLSAFLKTMRKQFQIESWKDFVAAPIKISTNQPTDQQQYNNTTIPQQQQYHNNNKQSTSHLSAPCLL